jgi:hypothetical protein
VGEGRRRAGVWVAFNYDYSYVAIFPTGEGGELVCRRHAMETHADVAMHVPYGVSLREAVAEERDQT